MTESSNYSIFSKDMYSGIDAIENGESLQNKADNLKGEKHKKNQHEEYFNELQTEQVTNWTTALSLYQFETKAYT